MATQNNFSEILIKIDYGEILVKTQNISWFNMQVKYVVCKMPTITLHELWPLAVKTHFVITEMVFWLIRRL